MSDIDRHWKDYVDYQKETLQLYGSSDNTGYSVLWAADRIAELEARLAAAEADADASADRNYIAGVSEGFRLGLENDTERKEQIISARRKGLIDEARSAK